MKNLIFVFALLFGLNSQAATVKYVYVGSGCADVASSISPPYSTFCSGGYLFYWEARVVPTNPSNPRSVKDRELILAKAKSKPSVNLPSTDSALLSDLAAKFAQPVIAAKAKGSNAKPACPEGMVMASFGSCIPKPLQW